ARPQTLFAPDERTDEGAFEKEREHALHCQCLSNHTAAVLGEARPVGPELKLHRNAGHHPHGEIEPEDLGPESRGLVVFLFTRPQGTPLPIHQEPRQAHRQLGEQVVVRDGERELDTVPEQCIFHGVVPRSGVRSQESGVTDPWLLTLSSDYTSHSGLLEPRGTRTVRKAPGVRDRNTWSVMP